MRDSVVLPVPGGPHKMSDGSARSAVVRSRMRPGADQVRLADELVEIERAHPLGERLTGAALLCSVTKQIHGHGYSKGSPTQCDATTLAPETSTP